MSELSSRRSFLAGVLASSTLSAAALYLLPGGRRAPDIRLNLLTGEDATGGRALLFEMWNRVNPSAPVQVNIVRGQTDQQLREMEDAASDGSTDVINLDIIDIPRFASQDLITPIGLDQVRDFLPMTLQPARLASDPDRFWAAPLNTDVGVLFERRPPDEPAPTNAGLADVVASGSPDAPQFVGQLRPDSSIAYEAFVVNVLEHALAQDPEILDRDGLPSEDLARWQAAWEPLRVAMAEGRVVLSDTEGASMDEFTNRPLRYMRNWPVRYQDLVREDDPDALAARIDVRSLPHGILGGQSLAVVTGSRHAPQARALIRFLTSVEAQKVLAAHGFVPTRYSAFSDPNLTTFIPHLARLQGAVENARLRPVHPRYREFSDVVREHTWRLLHEDTDLPSRFIDEMRAELRD